MTRTLALAFIVVLLLPFASIAQPTQTEVRIPEGSVAVERVLGLPGLENVGRVAPGILRGAQPEKEGYETLRKMGVRTVINLRTQHDEKAEAEAAGMRAVSIPMNTTGKVDPALVTRVVEAMRDPASQPVYVHCARGQDRTSAVVAAYRMEVDGWTNEEAILEAQEFGFTDLFHGLKRFMETYEGGK